MERYLYFECCLGYHRSSLLWKLGIFHVANGAAIVHERFFVWIIVDQISTTFNTFRHFKLQPGKFGHSLCASISHDVDSCFRFKLSRWLVSSQIDSYNNSSSSILQLFIVSWANCFHASGGVSLGSSIQCCAANYWRWNRSFFTLRLHSKPFRHCA